MISQGEGMYITVSMLADLLGRERFVQAVIKKQDKISTIRIQTGGERMEPEILYLKQQMEAGSVVCRTARGTSDASGI